jgi:hypothetical protein
VRPAGRAGSGADHESRLSGSGYTARMPQPRSIAQASLVGWRKAVADRVAPRAASRAPVSEEQLRAAIGAAFFLLSLYYVASTIARIIRSAQS